MDEYGHFWKISETFSGIFEVTLLKWLLFFNYDFTIWCLSYDLFLCLLVAPKIRRSTASLFRCKSNWRCRPWAFPFLMRPLALEPQSANCLCFFFFFMANKNNYFYLGKKLLFFFFFKELFLNVLFSPFLTLKRSCCFYIHLNKADFFRGKTWRNCCGLQQLTTGGFPNGGLSHLRFWLVGVSQWIIAKCKDCVISSALKKRKKQPTNTNKTV